MASPAEVAARLRQEAELVDLIAGVVFDAVSLDDAAGRLRAISTGKRVIAKEFDEMARKTS
ncbi:hypothetical protein GCM10010199_61500 [Dactylosporangium roseum]